MSGKNARQIRKAMNRIRRNEREVSDMLILELLNSPFKYRLRFALKIIFYRRKSNG